MSANLKQILIFIAVFIFLLIVGFNSYKYWNKEDAELELTREQNKRDLENDSLKMANSLSELERGRLKIEIDSLKKISGAEYTNRNNIITNHKKRNEQIENNPAAVNRRFNDNFILNYKPRY